MYRYFLIFFLVVTPTALVAAQDQGRKVEVFGGYTYLTIDDHKSNNPIDHVGSLDGFNVAVTGFISKRIGITGDFSAGYQSGTQAVTGGSLSYKSRNYGFYVGPHFRFKNTTRVTPFVHALVGASNNRFSYLLTPTSTPASISRVSQTSTDFAMALGGGLDVRVHKRVAIRLFQIDYNPVFAPTRPEFGTNTNFRFDNIRFSSGIVF